LIGQKIYHTHNQKKITTSPKKKKKNSTSKTNKPRGTQHPKKTTFFVRPRQGEDKANNQQVVAKTGKIDGAQVRSSDAS